MSMKIVKFTAQNYKRLVAVEISPDGNVVLLTGKNEQGKSSVLDGIVSTLQGKKYIPIRPIRAGEDYAETVVETENYIIKRTYTAAGGGSVTIKGVGDDGITLTAGTPQTLLDKIVGAISFDPGLFIRMGETAAGQREQLAIVMRLAKLDFSDIDASVDDLKQDRSDVRKMKEHYEYQAKQIVVAEDTPDKAVSMVELAEQLQKINNANNDLASKKRGIVEMESDLTDIVHDIDEAQGNIDECKRKILEWETELEEAVKSQEESIAEKESHAKSIGEAKKVIEDVEEIDPTEVNTKIVMAEETNAHVRFKANKLQHEANAKDKADKYRKLGKQMQALDTEKARRLSKAKMPIEGLSVDETGLIYFDKTQEAWIPLSQVNDAKKLEVSMGVAMAENPKLRVVLMKGNDLDEDSLKVISAMAADNDFQVWIERIEGKGGIVIEDGTVKMDRK